LNKFIRFSLLITLLLSLTTPAFAQEGTADQLIYIVQAGDTLWTIARRLHVYYDEMLAINGMNENSSIIPGTELIIPGLGDLSGKVSTIDVAFGETLQSISRRYQVSEDALIKINRLTSPFELYVGVSAVLVGENEIEAQQGKRVSLAPQESFLELAIKENLNPWTLVTANQQGGSWDLVPGEVLFAPGTESSGPGGFPQGITSVDFSPEQFIQGHTYVIEVQIPDGAQISGALGDYPLSFFTQNDKKYLSLQGLHAREDLGLKSLNISGTLTDGTPFALTQMVEVFSGNYHFEDIVGVPQETVGIQITEDEDIQLQEFTRQSTQNKFWEGDFQSPVPEALKGAYASYYGGRRSYNGSGYYYFHTGIDYFGTMGGDIYAPAPGKVVFTGPLLLHGNTTLINHGWGVYTLYAHQSEFLVEVGQQVSAGSLIGRVGSTGRSIGPHLHWEVWVGGIQVDPLDWVKNSYP
jgi:murein DD-endopeptidase MepM/ murein hydrolase activator NlpD